MSFSDTNLHALDVLAGAETGFALSVLNASPDCIKLLDLDGRLCFMNGNGLCAMEIAEFASVDRQPWPALWPAEAHVQITDAIAAAKLGQISRFDAFCPTQLGTPRWWHVTVSPISDGTGAVRRILASSRDITDTVVARQKLEQEIVHKDAAIARQSILMGEIDHRVKNSFAAVIALLRMQARMHSDGPAGAQLSDAANRISTLARVHEQLHLDPTSRDVSLRDYVVMLARDLCGALNARLDLDDAQTDEVRVPPAQAAAIGQILAELIGNAVKHARPGQQPGLVLRLSRQGDMLSLSLGDDGPGLPQGFDPELTSGLGMQICLIYAQQMGGEVHHGASDHGGAEFRVELRLDPAYSS